MDHSREDQVKFAKHFERAQGWLLLDKFDSAVEALAEVPAVFSSHPEVMFLRARIHMATGKWSLAEPLLRQLVENNADEPMYRVNLAYVVRRSKSIGEAEPTSVHFPQDADFVLCTVAFTFHDLGPFIWPRPTFQAARISGTTSQPLFGSRQNQHFVGAMVLLEHENCKLFRQYSG